MSPITAMTAMTAAYQWSVRNFFKDAIDLSDNRIFRRVARGPEGSTCRQGVRGLYGSMINPEGTRLVGRGGRGSALGYKDETSDGLVTERRR